MKRTIALSGAAAFLMAFLGGMLAFSLAAPSLATAQSSQLQEVRASAFVLVGPDGTVLGRLAPGPTGNGNLALFDTAGTRRVGLAAAGLLNIFDADGATRVRLGFDLSEATVTENVSGPINGIQLDRYGSITILPGQP